MMRHLCLTIVFVFATLAVERPALAAPTCTFGISGINFGKVSLLGGSAVDGLGTLSVNCSDTSVTLGLAIRVCPGISAGSGGSVGTLTKTRLMSGPSSTGLRYQLYSDATRSKVWGSTPSFGLATTPPQDLSFLLTGTASRDFPIYARIEPNQSALAGGLYSSSFGTADVKITYSSYLAIPPACDSNAPGPVATTSFTVQAIVDRSCDVDAEGLNFGNVAAIDKDIDAVGKINVTCTPNLSYTVALNGGLSNASQPAQRKMVKGTDSILYGLYQNVGRTTPWGSTGSQLVNGTGNGAAQDITVYGRVPKQTTPPPGTYSDTVVVTVTY